MPVYLPTSGAGEGDAGLVRADDWQRLGTGDKDAAGGDVVQVGTWDLLVGDPAPRPAPAHAVPREGLGALHIRMLLVTNDGRPATFERLRTVTETAVPGSEPITVGEVDEEGYAMVSMLQRIVDVGIILCLVIAGCSLAVSVAGGLIERKRPFSLLRLAGMPLSHLRRVVMLEAVVPLVLVAIISAAAGLLAAHLILGSFDGQIGLAMPEASYWAVMIGGLVGALGVVAMTLPLIDRVTRPQSARME